MADGVLSLNDRSLIIAKRMIDQVAELRIEKKQVAGACIIDAGVDRIGTLDAGLLMAQVCLADLASVRLAPGQVKDVPTPLVCVNVNHPVPACMASQYAGWQIKTDHFFAMGSGPFRAAYGKEELYDEIGFRENPTRVIGVLETGSLPDEQAIDHIAKKCQTQPSYLTLIVAKTASLAGGVQVVARSVETAMHKLHTLGFDLKRIVGGYGHAPLPPVAKNDMKAIGRTNDSILYGGQVTLFVTGDDASLREAGEQLPSSASKDYGQPFADIFKSYNYDFYQIDPMLFSPASICLQNIETGNAFHFGQINHDILSQSFWSS